MIDYYEYIRSDEWQLRTEEIRKRDHCELCLFRNGSCVHHRTYERLGQEKPEDLILLCAGCHNLVHKHLRLDQHYIWPSRLEFLAILQKEVEKHGS